MSKAFLKLFARSQRWPRKRLIRTHQTASFTPYENLHSETHYIDDAARLKSLGENFVSSDENVETFYKAGCFWGVELAFQRVPGVLSTSVGYCGGRIDNPTYEVCSGRFGHTEACKVDFDTP